MFELISSFAQRMTDSAARRAAWMGEHFPLVFRLPFIDLVILYLFNLVARSYFSSGICPLCASNLRYLTAHLVILFVYFDAAAPIRCFRGFS